jgi:hypothetical protein
MARVHNQIDRELGLWRQIAVSVLLPDRVYARSRPYLRPLVRTRDEHALFIVYRIRRSGPKGGRQCRLRAHPSGGLTQWPDGVGRRHAHEHQIRICDRREGADGGRCVDQHVAAGENERIDQDIDCIGNG